MSEFNDISSNKQINNCEYFFRSNSYVPRLGIDNLTRLRLLLRTVYESRNVCSWISLAPTGSMDPIFKGRVEVLVKWGEILPQLGDVILYVAGEGILGVHRTVAIRTQEKRIEVLQMSDRFIYRNPYSGGWIPKEHILGQVIELKRLNTEYKCIALNTSISILFNKIISLNLRILWSLGNEQVGWSQYTEPVRKISFELFKFIHLIELQIVSFILRILSSKN
jgi:hypothetical protein